jgi:hypothetical protein
MLTGLKGIATLNYSHNINHLHRSERKYINILRGKKKVKKEVKKGKKGG